MGNREDEELGIGAEGSAAAMDTPRPYVYPLVDRSGVDDADTTLPTPKGVPAPMVTPSSKVLWHPPMHPRSLPRRSCFHRGAVHLVNTAQPGQLASSLEYGRCARSPTHLLFTAELVVHYWP
jgi:hypothetical protein